MNNRPRWIEYQTPEMDLPTFETDRERSAEIERRKAILAIEAMTAFLADRRLTESEQRLFSTGRKLYRQGNIRAAFTTLRRLSSPIQNAEISAVLMRSWE